MKRLSTLSTIAIFYTVQIQANAILAQCDFNHNGKIDTRKEYKKLKNNYNKDGVITPEEKADLAVYKINGKKENKCKFAYENAQLDKESKQLDKGIEEGKKRIEQLDKIIKILDTKK